MNKKLSVLQAPRLRTGAAVATAVVLAFGLGACGDSGNGGSGSGDSSTSADGGSALLPEAEGTTQYPLTLDSPWGETSLEQRPERVAVLAGEHDGEYLSMLGVTPVFAPSDIEEMVWMQDAFPQEIENTAEVDWNEPPYEALAAAKPDLIVATFNIDQSKYDRLKTIAPVATVSGENGEPEAGETWEQRMTDVGEALDLKAAAEEKIGEQEETVAKVREDHPEFDGKTITYAVYYDTETGLNFNNVSGSNSEAVFSDMGFAENPNSSKFVNDPTVSNEKLPELDADVMLISDNSARGESASTINTIKDLDLYKNLPVVKNGHTVDYLNTIDGFEVDGEAHEGNVAWALHVAGPMGEVWATETLAPLLSDAIQD
ncbi:hypothetical protein FCK90_10805 [Kocuria coralli]|uniref:Fe/B12 periplasmic-binding domain-containing protein n=1 Tax=Kocuria coralli TaxID=1461025 RepID=A0A5J5KVF1_9MICC|nr:ABC transporter substrate-binding protein [Kocuria coralli]KAA9393669.1 hypothetical protein FCK90_10805 [Kocuria coralli]